MTGIDSVALNFNPQSLMVLNIILGVVMFGIALDLTPEDFRRVWRTPKMFLTGLFSQFVFLPAATFALVLALQPPPSIALGLMLVAACPGGNISNFITHMAGGNTALSVSMTAVATLIATLLTPFNVAFWGGQYPPTAELLRATSIDPVQMAFIVGILLVVPLILGMLVRHIWPGVAARLRGPFRILSMLVFAAFVVGALAANWQHFLAFVGVVALLVLIHNGIALAGGYLLAFAAGLPEFDRRAISIETGIQNSGLGLILIFNFFGGLGGMAIAAAWWGVWHIISGMALAMFFRRWPAAPVAAAQQ